MCGTDSDRIDRGGLPTTGHQLGVATERRAKINTTVR